MRHAISETAFKSAMRKLAAGVSVITSASGERRGGMTATAVCSLSAQPPQLLICVNRSSSTHDLIVESGVFCVNILADTHQSIASAFSSAISKEERFEAGHWIQRETGAPVLEDASVAFDCEVVETITSATHSIIIGRIVDVWAVGEPSPLIYFQSHYAALSPISAG